MENQKIINLLNKSDTNSKHFATKKWYIINDENNTNYGVNKDTGAGAPDTIKYDTRVLKPNLCDYAVADLTANNSSSFKYKINLLGDPVHAGGIAKRNVKVVVPLKYLSNFFRSLEMPLINFKIKLNLTCKKNAYYQLLLVLLYLLSMIQNYTFQLLLCQKKIISILLNNKIKDFNDLFIGTNIKQKKRDEDGNANVTKYISLDPSFQSVNRLFLMACSREANQPTRNGHQKYYLSRIDLKKHNVIIDGRNFYDNPIENNSEKYRELKKVMIGKGEDYSTGSLLDYKYFTKHYKLVSVHLSKQKELDADPRAIQQIEFKYTLETNSTIYWVLEKSKETILEF